MRSGCRIVAVAAALCLTVATQAQERMGQRLDSYVSLFESGQYVAAVDSITAVFPVVGEKNELRAYKYLAYSYAMLQMTARASAVFAAALEKYPGMAIDTLEAPPSIVNMFQEVRIAQRAALPREVRAQNTTRLALGALLGIASAGGIFLSGYLIGSANGETPALIGGAAAGAVSAIILPISMYLVSRPDSRRGKRIAVRTEPVWLAAQ